MDIHFTMISLGLRNLSNYDTIRAIEHIKKGEIIMERIKTLDTRDLCESAKNGGCGECQTSCQSACKTSCGVANQKCENKSEK
jgi:predicted ribosomally synthesized six-cysteine peptide SCIFF